MHLPILPLLKFVMLLVRSVPAFFRNRNDQAVVELALRRQLATFAVNGPKPRITSLDRTFWVFPSRIWSGWRKALVIIQPDTVVRWHRKGFRLYWRSISKRGPGRYPIPLELQTLIRRFATENGWRTRKIQVEIEKQRLLREYVDYYDADRVHNQLRDSQSGRPTEHRPSLEAQIIGKLKLGGLHHRYEWQEAA